jgi:hypothetical protein
MTHHHPLSSPQEPSPNWRVALSATIHCLTGCAIGEVLGMVIGTALDWSNAATVVLSILLAFFFGYALTLRPLVSSGMALRSAISLAFAADTISIAVMEIVDNALMLAIPGAMDSPITSLFFWSALAFSLVVAGIAAFPINAWLIKRGRGHARVHAHHDSGHRPH